MKKVGVALLGLGTVGGGTYRILEANREMIKKYQGVDLTVEHVLEKNLERCKQLGVDEAIVSTDINNVLNNPKIKIVAEFFGGIEPAKTFLIKSLEAGKSIVTANKELVAKYWHELEVAAKKGKAGIYFEASCVGGVPIIRTLIEGMQGNNIQSIKGIVNGTTNYILTKMADTGANYADALREAQELGYAEFNPTADVEGYDASYKLSILSSLAFRTKVPLDKVSREGISTVKVEDIEYGKELGMTLKLLAIGKNTNGKIEARVHPTFVDNSSQLALVKGSFNAVSVVGDAVGEIMEYGRGAGDLPTGSAIVSDIVYAALKTKHTLSNFNNTTDQVSNRKFIFDYTTENYLRVDVQVSANPNSVVSLLKKHGVKLSKVSIKPLEDKVSIVMLTETIKDSKLNNALSLLPSISGVIGHQARIRIER